MLHSAAFVWTPSSPGEATGASTGGQTLDRPLPILDLDHTLLHETLQACLHGVRDFDVNDAVVYGSAVMPEGRGNVGGVAIPMSCFDMRDLASCA